jgi:hypothetical protein
VWEGRTCFIHTFSHCGCKIVRLLTHTNTHIYYLTVSLTFCTMCLLWLVWLFFVLFPNPRKAAFSWGVNHARESHFRGPLPVWTRSRGPCVWCQQSTILSWQDQTMFDFQSWCWRSWGKMSPAWFTRVVHAPWERGLMVASVMPLQ